MVKPMNSLSFMSAFSRTLFVQLQWRFSRFAVMYFLGKFPCFGTFQAKKSKWLSIYLQGATFEVCELILNAFMILQRTWIHYIEAYPFKTPDTVYHRLNRVTPIDQFAHLSPNIPGMNSDFSGIIAVELPLVPIFFAIYKAISPTICTICSCCQSWGDVF
jgi:hypothetical protein